MKKSGFTFVEVLIVIVIIAILAALVVPRLLAVGREARESSLKAHLQEMRNAIGRFQKELGGYPARLEDIVSTIPPAVNANGDKIDAAKFKGPYLPNTFAAGQLPDNPVTGDNAEGVDWLYTPSTGQVHAKAGAASDGTDYSNW